MSFVMAKRHDGGEMLELLGMHFAIHFVKLGSLKRKLLDEHVVYLICKIG
jgi:hypothetical protein